MAGKRTAADDLRDLGYPTDPATSRTAVEDVEEELDETKTEAEETDETKIAGESEDLDDELEPGEEDEKDEAGWKKRFVGSQKQHLEDKRRIDALEAKQAQLEQQLRTQPIQPVQPAPLARDETAARLQSELDLIPSTDADARKKVIEKWVGTVRTVSKEEGEAAAIRVVTTSDQKKKEAALAEQYMKDSLKKKGLDPDKYFKYANSKVRDLKADNMQWFTDVPASQQFDAIADLVLADRAEILAEKSKEANMALRKNADGIVGKSNKTVTKAKSTDKEDVPDRSFTQQQRDVQALRLKDGNRRYAEAGR